MPFPNTRVIPAGWGTHHRPVTEDAQTATISIRRPGGTKGAFDTTTGTYPVVPHVAHYTGTARVQVLPTQEQEQLVADDQVTTIGYRVTTGLDATGVVVGDVVTITAVDTTIGDAAGVGQELVVESFDDVNSLAWERALICTRTLG